ncbi:hypothetical protein EDEG_03117, partial [Edhazardia aedis USNM 41457]
MGKQKNINSPSDVTFYGKSNQKEINRTEKKLENCEDGNVVVKEDDVFNFWESGDNSVKITNKCCGWSDISSDSAANYKKPAKIDSWNKKEEFINNFRCSDKEEYNKTDKEEYNKTDKEKYNKTDKEEYNKTDLEKYNKTDLEKYNKTDKEKYNKT